VWELRVHDPLAKFDFMVKIKVGLSYSRCFELNVNDITIKVSEFNELEHLSVALNYSSATTRVFFLSFDKVGCISNTCVVTVESCGVANINVVLALTIINVGQNKFVPEKISITTDSTLPVAGYFDLRYGFRGLMNRLLFDVNAVPIQVDIVPGSRELTSASSLYNMLAAGMIIRIKDEEVVVDYVDQVHGYVRFHPYHIHGATRDNIMVSNTLVGVSSHLIANNGRLSIRGHHQFHQDVFDNDRIFVQGINSSNVNFEAYYVVSGDSDLLNCTLGSFTVDVDTVAVYREQNVFVPYDASPAELKKALESIPTVGTVDVERYGPNNMNSYTWSISFTSTLGTTRVCGSDLNSCLRVLETPSSAIQVTCGAISFQAVSDSYYNGRRKYVALNSPFAVYHNVSSWLVVSTNYDLSENVIDSHFSFSTSPVLSSACTAHFSPSPSPILTGTVSRSILHHGLAPSFANVFDSQVISLQVREVQAVILTSSNGLLFGGFSLDFNKSNVLVYFRVDESAADFETKFESLPTVGDVSVTRDTIEGPTGLFLGYRWSIEFISNQGDLPAITYSANITDKTFIMTNSSLSPSAGVVLKTTGLSLKVVEVNKGVALDLVTKFSNLVPGSQYSLEITPSNSAGAGVSSAKIQNFGMGILPLSVEPLGHPGAPTIEHIGALSSSQLYFNFGVSADTGGSAFTRYLLEYTSDSNFDVKTFHEFEVYNSGPVDDSEGYYRLSYHGSTSPLIPFRASAADIAAVFNDMPSITDVTVNRRSSSLGDGYKFTVSLLEEIGSFSTGKISMDMSRLTSESLTDNFHFIYLFVNETSIPADYGAVWLYSDCGTTSIGSPSQHQVLTIEYAIDSAPGAGSFRLFLGESFTVCLPYDIVASVLMIELKALYGVDIVFIEERFRSTGTTTYRDLHIFFEGIWEDLTWPLLRVSAIDNGLHDWTCVARTFATTNAVVVSINDKAACLNGKSEIQTIVLDSSSAPGGYFFVYYRGEKSGAIPVLAGSIELSDILNSMNSFENVQVTKYSYGDGVFNSAWVVTFPPEYGNVEELVIDDQSVTGVDCAVHVFPMVNISIVADKNDLSGFFQIAVGSEITIPLAWDASDASILNALHNLTNVGKVQMLGLSENYASVASLGDTIDINHVGFKCEINGSHVFHVGTNLTGKVSVGDRVFFCRLQ